MSLKTTPAFLDFRHLNAAGRGQAAQPVDLENLKVGELRVRKAEYTGSSVTLEQCPPPIMPEIAVIGRSNVGKSSLINMLTGRRDLALVSKTPGEDQLLSLIPKRRGPALPACPARPSNRWIVHAGKTQCINHFLINGSWYLVDLPGYG